MMMSVFAAIASTWPVRTVSRYAAAAGVQRYVLGEMVFPVVDGQVVMPDVLGRQLELRRLGRADISAFDVGEDGALVMLPGPSAAPPLCDAERGVISEQLQAAIDDAIAVNRETYAASAVADIATTAVALDQALRPASRKRGKR